MATKNAAAYSWRAAASKATMRAGRHFAQLTMVEGNQMVFGVIRVGWDVENGANAYHADYAQANGHCIEWEGMQPAQEGDRIGMLLGLDQAA